MPRYIIIVKSPEETECCDVASKVNMVEAISKFNGEMVAAGVMCGGEGLKPSAKEGYRVHFSGAGAEPTVEKGPFSPENRRFPARHPSPVADLFTWL
jgi:hypothetical protein